MGREMLGTVLAAAAYMAVVLFSYRVIWRIVILSRKGREPQTGARTTPVAVLKAIADVFFLWRLLRANRLLWLGEWAFHVSFAVVVIGHLRFFLYPVPGWLVETRGLLGYAGYVFVASLAYISVFKLLMQRERPLPVYNLFLIAVALLTGLTGMLMGKAFKPDLVEVKDFVLSALALRPEAAPEGALFTVHFLLVLVFVLFLPAHLFTAPVVMLEARRREEGLGTVLHEK